MEDLGLTAIPGLLALAAAAFAIRALIDRATGRSGCDSHGDWIGDDSNRAD